jgi:murein L,D-transpeptidase YcbB/YkuD
MMTRFPVLIAICVTLAGGIFASSERSEPPFAGYQRAKQMLAQYRKLAASDNTANLPVTPKPLKPGDLYAARERLANWLVRLHDLPPDAPIAGDRYDGVLVDAVKRFQARHGLDPDGIIGKVTFNELNTPLSFRVRQLELTLERWREIPTTFPRPPIIINIPEFKLRALDENFRATLTMNVVVGKAWGHQTPVFSAAMRYLTFRPYWDVPPDIVRKELMPRLDEDPEYFARNHFEFVPTPDGGTRVRQLPGPDNALGGVKFIFPNPYDVYLHGTPAMELFAKSRRDFSHGCIRVEKPEELAAWVLRDRPEWTPARIRTAMNADRPLRIDLKSPIPVLIVYGTAVVSEDGIAHFYRDIYGLDQ